MSTTIAFPIARLVSRMYFGTKDNLLQLVTDDFMASLVAEELDMPLSTTIKTSLIPIALNLSN